MDQACMDSLDLVGTDRGSDTAPTDRNATLHLSGYNGAGQGDNIVGIIIVMIKLMSAEIHDLVSGSLKLGDQLFLEFKPSMISCKSNAHDWSLFRVATKARGKHARQIGLRRGAATGSTPRMYFGVNQMKA